MSGLAACHASELPLQVQVSVSHHGMGPASRYKPSQYDMRVKDEVHPLKGFVVQTWNKAFGPADGAPSSEISFVPPALAR